MNENVGKQLGNYRLIRLLGQGGFADVYLGEHVYLNTLAAIKVLQTRLAKDDLEVFLKEARAISSLIHPHIVRVLEFGVEPSTNTPFLVMDYAPNGTLRQRHPRGPRLAPSIIVPYVKQVASALQYAHDKKLIHRDVKPENMLVNQNNEVLLSDFGIAVVTQSSRYQKTQEVVGTIGYMAPEQLHGRPVPASDQYALAVTVYEWLSGDRPFHGSFAEVASQHLVAPPSPLYQRIPGVTPVIDEVVQRGLAKDPEQRFMRISAFATAFEQACQSAQASQPSFTVPPPGQFPAPQPANTPPTFGWSAPQSRPPSPNSGSFSSQASTLNMPPDRSSAPNYRNIPPSSTPNWGASAGQSAPNYGDQRPVQPPSPGVPDPYDPSAPTYVVNPPGQPPQSPGPSPDNSQPPKKKGVSRRAVVLGLAGAGGLILVGGGFAAASLLQHQNNTHLTTSTGTASSSSTPGSNSTPAQTATPASTDTSVPGSGTSSSPTTSSSQTVPNPGAVTFSGHTRYVTAVAWSPDGTKIASASGDNTVQVWDASNGNMLYNYSGHKNPVNTVAWSNDGKNIFSASDDIQIWDATNGTKVFSYVGHTSTVRCLAVSPDGKRVVSGSDDSSVQVWDANSGTRFVTHNANAGVRAVTWSNDGKHIASTKNDQVEVWDSGTGNTINTYNGHSGNSVNAVVWSHDGKHVASGSDDRTVQIWDAFSLSPSYTYPGHSQAVYAVSWSHDDTRIASGSADTTVQVWSTTNGSNRFVYHNHSSRVNTVVWSPDGTHIASGSGDPNISDGSDDHTVQIWSPA